MRRLIALTTACCLSSMQPAIVLAQVDQDLAGATAANQAARASVTTQSATAHVPGYTLTPPETVYHGKGNLKSDANAHLAACALTPGDPACAAQVGALNSANTPRPPVLATDPAIAAAQAIARDPLSAETALAAYTTGCPAGATCAPKTFCLGTQCFSTSYTNDVDFAQVMTYMEAVREAGVYLDPKTMTLFNGEGNTCRNRLLKNCCYTDGAGAHFTNQSLFGIGSRLVFDILMNSGNREFITQGAKALLTSGGFSGSYTTFGVTVAVNGTALPAGSVTLATTEHLAIAFNPWSLAMTAVMYIAVSMMSCNAGEGKLAMKEGAQLCHTIGTWCSACIRVLGKCVSCIEHTTSKCCFNSRLAKMINEQGRAQLGMGWGVPKNPACSGFSVDQLQSIDFAKLDLTEFYASIVPTLPNAAALKDAAAQRAPSCYLGRGKC